MDIKERLSFFQEMVQCEYPLHLWHYSPEFELIETDCPAELMLPDHYLHAGFFLSRTRTYRIREPHAADPGHRVRTSLDRRF